MSGRPSTALHPVFDFAFRPGGGRGCLDGEELIVDSFAGGGGASMGIEQGAGRCVDLAVNHNEDAIQMHRINHPNCRHLCENVWKVDPIQATQGRPVGLAWFSPDCTHFSRAKGGVPVKKKIRGLAWVVCRWASLVKPRIIMLENVREFRTWGPLNRNRRPLKSKEGETFNRWIEQLQSLGYSLEQKVIDAADFGAPTHRRRLFIIARRDGQPIHWPAKTHGRGLLPYHTAAECIDWTIPCPSIFERRRPLAEKTMRRIAMGLKRYVLDHPSPFIVNVNHGGGEFRGQTADAPLRTVTAKHGYGVVVPIVSQFHGQKNGESRCQSADTPLNTLDTQNRYALVSAWIIKHFGGMVGVGADTPLPTTLSSGAQNQVAVAHLAPFVVGAGGSDYQGKPVSVDKPQGTILPQSHLAVVTPFLAKLNHGEKQWSSVEEPLGTVTAGGKHFGLVYAFLQKYFGAEKGQHQPVDGPLHTQTSRDRFGLVVIKIDGREYAIADIGMRMLTPRELARAQGFPDDYVLTGTRESRVHKIGNSVCPVMAKVLVQANFGGAKAEVAA